MRCIAWASALCLLLLLCFAGRAWAEEIRVCVRPPEGPPNLARWAYSWGTASLLTSDVEVFMMKTHGQTIYVFDPSAPPENTKLLPIGHDKLKCSARVLPRKRPDPKPAPKKDEPPEDDKKRAKVKKEDKSDPPAPPAPLPQPIECQLREPPPESTQEEVPPPKTVLPKTTVLPRTTILPRAGSPGTGKGNGRGTKKGV